MKLLKKGDRVRLKVRTLFGWKGKGTVIRDQLTKDSGVTFRKDGDDEHEVHEYEIGTEACRHEVAVMRPTR